MGWWGSCPRYRQVNAPLVEAGLDLSVGSAGDAYDNAMAETVIGLYKTEVIRRDGPWRHLDDVG